MESVLKTDKGPLSLLFFDDFPTRQRFKRVVTISYCLTYFINIMVRINVSHTQVLSLISCEEIKANRENVT